MCKEMTYQRSSADLDAGGSLSNSAVSSCEDSVGVQKSSSTEVASGSLDGDDEGEVARSSGNTTDDVVLGRALIPVGDLRVLRLRDGC